VEQPLYGLKQAPRDWDERLRDFLLSKDFKIEKVDTTLFTKRIGKGLFVCQIYVHDIIFGSTNELFCEEFGKMMSKEFEISMIGELSFFLCLQIKQLKDGIFVSQTKYLKDMLKKFGLEDVKPIKTSMATNIHLDLDEGVQLLMVVYFTLPHLGLMLCLVYACVLDFKHHLQKFTRKLHKEF
jgi:hypothetical protein